MTKLKDEIYKLLENCEADWGNSNNFDEVRAAWRTIEYLYQQIEEMKEHANPSELEVLDDILNLDCPYMFSAG